VWLRKGSWDAGIWHSVRFEYARGIERLTPGDLVLDVGCHIGAFSILAAERGARVVGYEANRENHALACINTNPWPGIEIRFGAVWRSDQPPALLHFRAAAAHENTGGGSVLLDPHQGAASNPDSPTPGDVRRPNAQSSHPVPAVPLDSILDELGPVRLMKIDVEGSEFPILLTATRLRQVETIVGEYHELGDTEMANLSQLARVGRLRYCKELLVEALSARGFTVQLSPTLEAQGLFVADRS
jgi:FkbM family methyltransferase